MKFTFSIGVIVTAVICSCFCNAQTCDTGLNPQDYQCYYRTCHQQIVAWYPNGQDGDENIVCSDSVPCCGQLFTSCSIEGVCDAAKKAGMSAAVRKYLEKLTFDSEILVADCNGHYAPLKPAPLNPHRPAALAILDDRLWR